MQISKFDNKDKGFTLTELIVVVAGLATLASISIPRFQDTLKLNRVEEVKALLNSYASDCLRKTRTYEGNDLTTYLSKNGPEGLDGDKLSTLGYKFDSGKINCNNIGVSPNNEKDKSLSPWSF